MNNLICSILEIKYPIIQGAMARISDAVLAASVSNHGGLGTIAGGTMSLEELNNEIVLAKKLTANPFAVNLFLAAENMEKQIAVCIDNGVKIVTTGAGNPGPYIKLMKDNGMKVLPVVASYSLAKRLEAEGVDAIIAEGMEAGGHVGDLTTFSLIPELVKNLNIPVIAAGGIAIKEHLLAAFSLGAVAAQLGTKFLVATECNVHQNYKRAVIDLKSRGTVVVGKKIGKPMRVMRNEFSNKFAELEYSGASIEEIKAFNYGKYNLAAKDGDIVNGSVMLGQSAAFIDKESSAAEIIDDLMFIESEL